MRASVRAACHRVGCGRGDITGPVVGQRFFGYGNPSQIGAGLHQRLFARAFVVEAAEQRVLLLQLELGIMTELLRHRISEGLERRLPGHFRPSHVLMTATHTHAAPGGYSSYLLYASAVLGYAQRTIDRIVQGAVDAVVQAVTTIRPGRVRLGVGELEGACVNRSVEAFELNPEADRSQLPRRYETRMHQLSFFEEDGSPRALVNWFGVHGTSFNKHNRLVSGDNKGYASWFVEREKGANFVAGFGQGASADLSPNLRVAPDGTLEGEGRDNRESAALIGTRQAERALELLTSSSHELTGPVRAALAYVDFDGAEVPGDFTSTGSPAGLGPAVLGQSFIAGTKDGRGLDWVHEGMVDHRLQVRVMARLTGADDELVRRNHAPKLPFVRLSRDGPSAVPTRLPLQVMLIGDFALAAVPFEVTTVAGLRIRRRTAQALGSELDQVALCTHANAYASYLTTPEEYDAQRYEGASTLFGREQLGFVEARLVELVAHAKEDNEAPSAPPPVPPPLYELTFGNADREGADKVPPLVWYGDVFEDAPPEAPPGERVAVTFWSADPRHPPNATSLMAVQRWVEGHWVTIADDHAFETSLEWTFERGYSRCTVTWSVPPDTEAGTYRLVHRGRWGDRAGVPRPYMGTSRAFEVVGKAAPSARITLDAAPPFRGVSTAHVDRARDRFALRRFRRGDVVMRAGQIADEIAWVLQGQLSVRVEDLELARLGPGEVVGELSFWDDRPRSASVVTLEDTELLVLDRSTHGALDAEGNEVALAVERLGLEALTTRLRRADELLGRWSAQVAPPVPPTTRERWGPGGGASTVDAEAGPRPRPCRLKPPSPGPVGSLGSTPNSCARWGAGSCRTAPTPMKPSAPKASPATSCSSWRRETSTSTWMPGPVGVPLVGCTWGGWGRATCSA